MPTCPECAGNMKYDGKERRYVCHRCGLALRWNEIEEMRDKTRDAVEEERGTEWKEEQRKKDYLKWWLSEKE